MFSPFLKIPKNRASLSTAQSVRNHSFFRLDKKMEHVGAICEGEWSSFNGMCSDEADFMAQFLGNCSSLPDEVLSSSNFFISSSFWPAHEANVNIAGVDDSAIYSDETTNSVYCFAQGNSCSGGSSSILFPSSIHESYYPSVSHQISLTDNNLMTMDHDMMDRENYSFRLHLLSNNVMEKEDHFLNHDVSNDSMESNGNLQEKPMPKSSNEDKIGSPWELSKKRPRIPVEVQKNKRNTKMKKILKLDNNDECNNNNNAMPHRQSSSSCCSEDDSNGSQELNVGFTSSTSPKVSGAIHLSTKTRASRGAATDPQSLYARKRRERINERLRILQSLVPNGTKVDISTMLEEAVEYVKFLQLQIKLLSSDELWMYAPIAYNGMDIGLDLRITTPKSQSS